jgi:uncharacterized protein (DUF983 family)
VSRMIPDCPAGASGRGWRDIIRSVPCMRCGRRQTDPVKGESAWAVVVLKGEQSLVCPICQSEAPDLLESADRCPECGSTRLRLVMGSVVCRQCGRDFERTLFL